MSLGLTRNGQRRIERVGWTRGLGVSGVSYCASIGEDDSHPDWVADLFDSFLRMIRSMFGLKSCGKLAFGPQPLKVTGDLLWGFYDEEVLLDCRKEALPGAGGGLEKTGGFDFSLV